MKKIGNHNPLQAPLLAALLAASLTSSALAGPEEFVGPVPMKAETPAPVAPKVPAPVVAETREAPVNPTIPQTGTQPQPTPSASAETNSPVKPLDLAPLVEAVKATRPNPEAQMSLVGKPKAEAQPVASPAEPASAGLGVTRTILSLSVVVALILLIAGVVKKLSGRVGGLAAAIGAGGKAPSGILSILGRYPLDRGTTLILLRVDRRVLLLSQTRTRSRFGAATTSIATLSEFTADTDVASIVAKASAAEGKSPSQRFQDALEDEGVFPQEPAHATPVSAPARSAAAPKPARKQSEQEALTAMLRAAIEASKAERPATSAAPARSAKVGGSDAAAELRTRLAAMRAKAALGGNGRRTEMVA